MEWIAEAALRSLVVAVLVRLGIAALRITNPQQEKMAWTTLLVGALLMPVLVRWSPLPALPIRSFSAATLAIQGLSPGSGVSFRHVGAIVNAYVGAFLNAYAGVILAAYVAVSLLLLLRMAIGT